MEVKVKLKQIEGLSLAAHSNSNHWITMDAPPELGGSGSGSRPLEVLLMGIAGCAAMDIIAILKKKRVDFSHFETDVTAQRTDEHPHIYTDIHFKYTIYGKNIKPESIERAIKLTDEKYCGGIAMIRGVSKIAHNYEIKEF